MLRTAMKLDHRGETLQLQVSGPQAHNPFISQKVLVMLCRANMRSRSCCGTQLSKVVISACVKVK